MTDVPSDQGPERDSELLEKIRRFNEAQQQEARAAAAAPAPAPRQRASRAPWYAAIAAAAVVLLLGGLVLGQVGPFAKDNSGPWTAVLLSDNDVFFGHMKALSNDRIELTSVYYVQKPAAGADPKTQALSIVSLVANQIQCPKDDIMINRADIAYWEELQDSSYVVQQLSQLTKTEQKCYQPSAVTPAPAGAPTAPAATVAPLPAATPTPKK